MSRPPLWQLIVAMLMVAALYMAIYQWRLWLWRKPWLDEKIKCLGPCEIDSPRRDMLVNDTLGRYGGPTPYVCPVCYVNFLRKNPKKGKKAFRSPR